MFTSRAEYRLLLRVDNADLRLTEIGRRAGLVDDYRWDVFQGRRSRYDTNRQRLEGMVVKEVSGGRLPASKWLRQPGTTISALLAARQLELEEPVRRLDIASLETTLKYEGYLRRQHAEVARQSREENKRIPHSFKYASVPGLSTEVVHRLTQVRPETLGQAGRIPGVTPAALAVLSTFISRSA